MDSNDAEHGHTRSSISEISHLRAQLAALENEREMRIKLEKLLEVQTVQVDLQKELRIKTESLLQVEQHTTSKLRQQVDELRMNPGSELETRKQVESRYAQAQEHIRVLEQQLAQATAPETSDRVESQLKAQLEEQELLIKRLQEQMESKGRAIPGPAEGEVVRLQLLLQSRDKHLDELMHSQRKANNDLAEAQSEADVLRHQVRVLKKEVTERTEEIERQLNTERNLRADVFQAQAKLEQVAGQHMDERQRASNLAEGAASAQDRQKRVEQLEHQLAEEQTTSRVARDQLAAESEYRLQAKEQVIKHQTTTIETLSRELKEKQSEISKLLHATGMDTATEMEQQATSHDRDISSLLPAVQHESPRAGDVQAQRSLESVHRQLKAKDAKIAKQSERLQTLTDMLESRDKQLEELTTAKHDRDKMRHRVAEMEGLMKPKTHAVTHTETERRLIEQDERLNNSAKKQSSLEKQLNNERAEKETLQADLTALRQSLAAGGSNATALQEENAHLVAELTEVKRILSGRNEELRRAKQTGPQVGIPESLHASLPSLKRRLQQLEDIDKHLGRDVAVWLQDRENKIEGLNSTVALLRRTIDDLREGAGADVEVSRARIGVRALPEDGDSRHQQGQAADQLHMTQAAVSTASDQSGVPLGRDADVQMTTRAIPATMSATQAQDQQLQAPLVMESALTAEDVRLMTPEDICKELLARRQESSNLKQQVTDKQQLVLKLIEEANLCNAEVASLQQTVQQAYKAARKQDREYEKLHNEKVKVDQAAHELQEVLEEKERKISTMFKEHQQDTSGNATVDEMDQKVSWKLKVIAPRQHEIRHSMFLVLTRRQSEALDKIILAQGLAHHFAVTPSRIEIVEDARLPDSSTDANMTTDQEHRSPSPSPGSQYGSSGDGTDTDGLPPLKRDLVLVNISDSETDSAGQIIRSTVSAIDVLDQVRNDMLKGHRVGPIDAISVDAVFINHGDMILPFEWPTAQAKLLLREGRVLAGKHAVVTVHEVCDPYVLRIVAYDTEVGREFVLFLNTRDVLLLLDTRDAEAAQGTLDSDLRGEPPSYRHLSGLCVSKFRQFFSVAEGNLLDIIVSSLSFSVWQNQQILVASEMRIPMQIQTGLLPATQTSTAQAAEEHTTLATLGQGQDGKFQSEAAAWQDGGPHVLAKYSSLPEMGVTRGLRPSKRAARRLFEDVLSFEGHLCIFSLIHTSAPDFSEDMLRATVYYPKTSAQIEACLSQPMITDRLRIVAEAGELDSYESLSVVIVVEEQIYPPAFLVRLTSVSLDDAYKISPKEQSRPHSHVIRVTKDGSSALQLPDISFAISPSTLRDKLVRCISSCSTSVHGPRETMITMPSLENITGRPTDAHTIRQTVTGHVNERAGLRIQLANSKDRSLIGAKVKESDGAAGAMPLAMRAQLRAKYGKGRHLLRQGRMLPLRGSEPLESIRAVISIFEREQPYQHFVICAYEPQTSREWEVLADSIDIYKLFTNSDEEKSQALDLANPATRQQIAEVLVTSVELVYKGADLVLVVSAQSVKERVESHCQKLSNGPDRTTDARPAIKSGTGKVTGVGGSHLEQFDVQPITSKVLTRAIGGFSGDCDREQDTLIEQRSGDLLFSAQRRLSLPGKEQGDLFRIQIYDAPIATALHSYLAVATPAHSSPLSVAGLPIATHAEHEQPSQRAAPKAYMIKIDSRILDTFLWDTSLLEPSRQEELLHHISQSLYLDEDRHGQLRLCLKKKKVRAERLPEIKDTVGETGAIAPATYAGGMPARHGSSGIREIGGAFPLNRLRTATAGGAALQGPCLRGAEDSEFGNVFVRGWKKIYSMAQRFGNCTVVISVSKLEAMYKLSVYEPDSSALYEMATVTSNSSCPLNVLIERCDLAGKLDLILCMHEAPFPHQLSVNLIHVSTAQEFNLKIGDDLVYTMIENSRRDAFMVFFEQFITWGCIGFVVPPGQEEQALSSIFEETFAGNQIFERMQVEDLLEHHLNATLESGELKVPGALGPAPAKKIRVPVIRAQLDFLGKQQQIPSGISMQLLYHAERYFAKEKQTLLLRIHKRSKTNDIAITLRSRLSEGSSLPPLPNRCVSSAHAGNANGRPFETPTLGTAEAQDIQPGEVTLWLQDKCSRAPSGAYGEICEVPGIDKQLLLLITDEDSPRAIRVAIALAQLPFTVLFQVVLLEASEQSARVDAGMSLKPSSSRRVLQQSFQKHFGLKGGVNSATLAHLTSQDSMMRDKDLKEKLDDLHTTGHASEHLGMEHGSGSGGPCDSKRSPDSDDHVDVAVLHMCTKQKLGRMMVFTIYRDIIAQNMYLRVVMHDPVTKKDSHLTLLHYTTQRLLSMLRINRDMLEELHDLGDDVKQDRQQLRVDMGKLIVDHMYLHPLGRKAGDTENIDNLELAEGEDVDYELRMRDIMDSSKSVHLNATQQLLSSAMDTLPVAGIESGAHDLALAPSAAKAKEPHQKSLLDLKEDCLIHKAEKTVSGRRVLVAFYSETTKEDILNYSHNIRIVVACAQTLNILITQDFHEDTLELVCARRGKRHLMSATREHDLGHELWECLALQHAGQNITGITFAGIDG